MSKKIKKGLTIGFSIICVICLVVLFFANTIVEKKLETTLKTLPESVRFNYSALHVNVFQGMLFVENPELELLEGVRKEVNLKVKLEDFKLKNISYWEYIVNNTIQLDSILLEDAQISYIKESEKTKDSVDSNSSPKSASTSKQKGLKKFNKIIKIGNFDLSHATVNIFKGSKDSIFIKSENVNISFNDIYFDAVSAEKSIPFEYSDYRVITDSLKFNVGKFETIKLHDLDLTKKHWVVREFKLQTRYTKQELTKIIDKERDHFNVQVDSIYIQQPEFGFSENQFYFKTDTIVLQKPDLVIYRNKMVPDDYTIKPLYSKMLRDLKFDLTLPVLLLRDGNILYEEKVKTGVKPGEIIFADLNATIKNLSNTYTLPIKTELDINTKFMDSAPLHAVWTFDVNNESDEFMFKAQIGLLAVSQLNTYTENNLNLKLEGQFDEIYARINGNVNQSTIDFNVKYENMKVHVLNKKHKKNKFLSSVANIFISNDSKKEDNDFKKEKGEVTRDKTKSIFNFLWLNFKEGLKLVFIGDGII
ncbi:hypothetical protein [Formosa sp. PL04]|uniref:hypothetical protein n=1 Tax=Formosa sp. PL04 TaxID=3081755 RepID=UPI0029817EC4|nr:hypothetical protein [Formosa sp. PL04]MDW5289738.1 hypothetical protein [Formosa sp. PL04]